MELTDVAYRLQMKVSDWHWGVITLKANTPAFLMPEESGLTVDGDQLLINFEAPKVTY